MTKKVVLTEERIAHIKKDHPKDVELVKKYAKKVLKKPKYILEDKNKKRTNTGLVIRWIKEKGKEFPILIILKMKEKTDPKEYKNSIITGWKLNKGTYNNKINNSKILYKEED